MGNKTDKPMSPDEITKTYGITMEGHVGWVPEKLVLLKQLSKDKKNVLEIGMNGGNSTEIFLKNGCNVVSFDIGEHDYVYNVKKYFDITFPNKHELYIGDSKITIPLYHEKFPRQKFDVILVDGGHDYITALTDILNCKKFAKPDTILIVDDVPGTFVEVNQAWEKAIKDGIVKQDGFIKGGSIFIVASSGMSYGRYVL